MRSLPFALLAAGLLAGCAGGNIADRIGPTAGIVTEQLTRYGLDLGQTRCVSEALADRLTPLQMRRLERRGRPVTRGSYDPSRLTVRDPTYRHSTPPEERRGGEECASMKSGRELPQHQ